MITRRECVIGLVVVALCVLGFFVFRPTFADARLTQQRAPDRRIEGGFNRSSQHLNKGCCDEEMQSVFGSGCAGNPAIVRPASRGPARES